MKIQLENGVSYEVGSAKEAIAHTLKQWTMMRDHARGHPEYLVSDLVDTYRVRVFAEAMGVDIDKLLSTDSAEVVCDWDTALSTVDHRVCSNCPMYGHWDSLSGDLAGDCSAYGCGEMALGEYPSGATCSEASVLALLDRRVASLQTRHDTIGDKSCVV